MFICVTANKKIPTTATTHITANFYHTRLRTHFHKHNVWHVRITKKHKTNLFASCISFLWAQAPHDSHILYISFMPRRPHNPHILCIVLGALAHKTIHNIHYAPFINIYNIMSPGAKKLVKFCRAPRNKATSKETTKRTYKKMNLTINVTLANTIINQTTNTGEKSSRNYHRNGKLFIICTICATYIATIVCIATT